MFKYLLLTVRIFWRNPFYSLINILGLSLGLASCLVCYLHLSYELGYDHFHEQRDHLYRVVTGDMEENDYWVMMAAPVPPVLKTEFPEIREYVRMGFFSWDPKVLVQHGEKFFNERNFFMVDPSFFTVFSYRMILGDPETALSDRDGVVITESNATKYFGDEDPLGKVIRVNGEREYRVTAVIEDAPHNSHLDYSFLISFENLPALYGPQAPQSWGGYNYYAYVQLEPKADVTALVGKIKNYEFQATEERLVSFENFDLQPVSDIHFMSNRGNLKPAYNMSYVYIFWALAISLLFIAVINYINLTTAQSEHRIQEVALRKTVGAARWKIIIQFMFESLISAVIALVFAVMLLKLMLPFLNGLFENRMVLNLGDSSYILLLLGVTLVTGIIAGSYIAYFVSGHRPALILKGVIKIRSRDIHLRKALMFIQFGIVTFLIISSLTILDQFRYMRDIDLGLDKDRVVDLLIFDQEAKKKIPLLKQEILKSPLIISAGASAFQPGAANFNQSVKWEGQQEDMSMFLIPVDKDYISTMRMSLIEGDMEQIQAFSDSSYTWVLNESARNAIGWEQAYGKSFTAFGSDRSIRPVSGVVRDFKFMSLHHDVSPLALVVGNAFSMDRLTVRLAAGNIPDAMSFLEQKFRETLPGIPFEYKFFDESIDLLYGEEARSGRIIGTITGIVIIIALFGLFGLLSYTLKERRKEMAIRKVHGISILRLSVLVTRQYMILILLSGTVALPVAWILMNQWLQRFAYRITLTTGLFVLSLAIVIILVLITILNRTVKTARENPAEALQYE